MSLSLPYLNQSGVSDLMACLEVVGRTVRYPQVRIIWPLKVDDLGTEPQLIEVGVLEEIVRGLKERIHCETTTKYSDLALQHGVVD